VAAGIAVLNFSQHYPLEGRRQLLTVAKAVVKDLLQTYDSVPFAELPEKTQTPNEPTSMPKVTVRISPVSWLQNFSSATADTYLLPFTQIKGELFSSAAPVTPASIYRGAKRVGATGETGLAKKIEI
jgi:hypothetical protein